MSSTWFSWLTFSVRSLQRKKMAQPTSYDPNIIEIKSKVSPSDACPLNRASCVKCAHIPAANTAFIRLSRPLFVTVRDISTSNTRLAC